MRGDKRYSMKVSRLLRVTIDVNQCLVMKVNYFCLIGLTASTVGIIVFGIDLQEVYHGFNLSIEL